MPIVPDLLSEDPQTRSSSKSPTRTAKTKKDKKTKKKNEQAAAAPSVDEETPETLRLPNESAFEASPALQAMTPDPPSPTFEPTFAAHSPIIATLDQAPFARPSRETSDWEEATPFGTTPPGRQPPMSYPNANAPSSPPASSPKMPLRDTRGGFSSPSPHISPRPAYRQPIRPIQQDGHGVGNYPPTSPRGRPKSMPQQYPAGYVQPQFVQPAHQIPHDVSRKAYQSRSSSRRGPVHEFRAFDILPSNEDSSSPGTQVLITSTLNALYVHEVSAESLKYYGHLDGLRGTVLSAKVLPVSQRYDRLRDLRPLIAVVVHGPHIPQVSTDTGPGRSDAEHDGIQQAAAAPLGLGVTENRYQTTVEIYSLGRKQYIATLYRSPVVDVEIVPGQMFVEAPPPIGALSVDTKGRFITVISAISGEVYIYEAVKDDFAAPFRCIGKVWTSIPSRRHRTWSASSTHPTNEADGNVEGPQTSAQAEQPIISLSSRWLAAVPPVPSSKSTLHGSVDESLKDKSIPGFTSHTSGSHPPVTCELDAPFEESRINRAARDVTQEFLKGAQWVGSQGMQAWKSYWSKPEDSSAVTEPPKSPPINPQFPPTHASDDTARSRHHPTIVTILDLERLSEAQDAKPEAALKPAATFPLTDGCSFLSFSPNGLMLLTTSTKGDVQYVWDLMRMTYPRSDAFPNSSPSSGPLVRQVARFSRVTQASIVDVVWSDPAGERLAVLTERGTVHVHDLPSSAFSWPPPRPRRPSKPQKRQSDVAPPPSGWGAALSSVTGRAQPILSAARETRIPSLSSLNISAAGAGAGMKGGKLVATGFSKSVGAATGTVNSLYHMGENRLHIPSSSSSSIHPGIAHWMQQKDFAGLVVVGETKLQIYGVLRNNDLKGGRKRQSVIGHCLAEHSIPKKREPDPQLPNDGYRLGGSWPTSSQRPRSSRATATPFSHAELETCMPFQPFHTDGRVTLSVFVGQEMHTDHEPKPWIFGQNISSRQVPASNDNNTPFEAVGPMESFIRETAAPSEDAPAQVTISTKRKKVKKHAGKVASARELVESPETGDGAFDREEVPREDLPQEWLMDEDQPTEDLL